MKKLTRTLFGILLLASFASADSYKLTIPLDIDGLTNGLHLLESDGNNNLMINVAVVYDVKCLISEELTTLISKSETLNYNEEGINRDILIEFNTDKRCDATPQYTVRAYFSSGSGRVAIKIDSNSVKEAVGNRLDSIVAVATGEMTKIN